MRVAQRIPSITTPSSEEDIVGIAVTVTAVAVCAPQAVVAVIVALPAALAVITPLADTVAIALLLLVQVMRVSVALAGEIAAPIGGVTEAVLKAGQPFFYFMLLRGNFFLPIRRQIFVEE